MVGLVTRTLDKPIYYLACLANYIFLSSLVELPTLWASSHPHSSSIRFLVYAGSPLVLYALITQLSGPKCNNLVEIFHSEALHISLIAWYYLCLQLSRDLVCQVRRLVLPHLFK